MFIASPVLEILDIIMLKVVDLCQGFCKVPL